MKTAPVFLAAILALCAPRAYSQQDRDVYLSISKSGLSRIERPTDAINLYIPYQQRGAASSAADLLDTALPALVKSAGDNGLATAGLRGFASKQTAVFFDGMRIPADLTGTVDLSVVPAGDIERVEILPGAQSSIHGADAEGGVINFVTRTLNAGVTRADLSSTLSSYGGNSSALSFMSGTDRVKTSVSASREASDGFQQNSAARKEFYSGKTVIALNNGGKVSVNAIRSNSEIGVPGGTPVPIGQWDGSRERAANSLTDSMRSSLGLARAALEMPLSGAVSYSLSGQYGVNRILSHMPEYGADTLTRTLSDTAMLSFSFSNKGEAGVEYDKNMLRSDTYGDHFTQNTGLFAQWAFVPVKGLNITPSLRHDINVAYDNQTSPKLAVVYSPDSVWKFSAQTGRAWQAPTLADLYNIKGLNNPWGPAISDISPNLKPESSWQTQTGVAANFASGIWTSFNAYYADVKDRIALNSAKNWAAYNLDSAFNEGVEAGLGYKASAFSAGLGYVYNLSKGRTAGNYKLLSFSPKYRFTADAALKTSLADITAKGYYSDRQYSDVDYGGAKIPSYFTADLYLSRKFDRFEVFAGADNIFDEHYAQTADMYNGSWPDYYPRYFPRPGRVLKCGLSARFM